MTDKQRLAGRRLIVTGAASGIGAGIATLFAQQGARLLLLDVQDEPLAAVGKRSGQQTMICDVSDEGAVNNAVAHAGQTLGGLDGVLNVAGVLALGTVENTDFATFQRLVAVNLAGPFLMCRAALPLLRTAGGTATIVNIASLVGVRAQPRMAVYSATKAGLVAFGEALSGEISPDVRVNTICPGVIRTGMTEFMWTERGGDAEIAAANEAGVSRAGEPKDIASAALYLTSEESSFVNGATLVVSGGHFR